MTDPDPKKGHPFPRLVARLKKAGFTQEKAEAYAIAIGDTPELGDGVVLIRNKEGRVIDRAPAWVIG